MLPFSDLLKEILRRIGLVIILGIIVAALCCGYKYAKDNKAAKAANSEDTTTTIKLTDKEQTDVNNVIAVQDNMKRAAGISGQFCINADQCI